MSCELQKMAEKRRELKKCQSDIRGKLHFSALLENPTKSPHRFRLGQLEHGKESLSGHKVVDLEKNRMVRLPIEQLALCWQMFALWV